MNDEYNLPLDDDHGEQNSAQREQHSDEQQHSTQNSEHRTIDNQLQSIPLAPSAETTLILEELKKIASSVTDLSERVRKTEKNVKALTKNLSSKKSTSIKS